MVIKSKYPGTCRVCGHTINKGELIEWSRGKGAKHVDCYGVYNEAGNQIGSTCNCEDYPCCGH